MIVGAGVGGAWATVSTQQTVAGSPPAGGGPGQRCVGNRFEPANGCWLTADRAVEAR